MKKRIVSMFLILVMVFQLLPVSVFASSGTPQFDPALVAEIQALCGDKYDAEEILQTLYANGLVDATGKLKLQDSFNVDGITMTAAELKFEIPSHDAAEAVTIDGVYTTWGEMQELMAYYDTLEMLYKMKDAGNIELTDEHMKNLEGLLEKIYTEGLVIDGQSISFAPFADTASAFPGSGVDRETAYLTFSTSKSGGVTTVTASLDGNAGAEVTFDYRVVDGSATGTASGNGKATIAKGASSTTFTVTDGASQNENGVFLIQAYNFKNAIDKVNIGEKQQGFWETQVTVNNSSMANGTVEARKVLEAKINYTSVYDPTFSTVTWNNVFMDPTVKAELDGLNKDGKYIISKFEARADYPAGFMNTWDHRYFLPSDQGVDNIMIHGSTIIYNNLNQYGVVGNVTNHVHLSQYAFYVGLAHTQSSFSEANVVVNTGSNFVTYTLTDVNKGSGTKTGVPDALQQVWSDLLAAKDSTTGNDRMRDIATMGMVTRNASTTYTAWVQPINDKLSVTDMSVPAMDFSPGMTIPVTVTFDEAVKAETLNLKMGSDSQIYSPVEIGKVGKTFTFMYTVKDIDTANLAVTSLENDYVVKELVNGDIITPITNIEVGTHIDNAEREACRMITPTRQSSLKNVAPNYNYNDKVELFQIEVDTSNSDLYTWITDNAEYVETPVTVRGWGGNQYTTNYYCDAIFVSGDGGVNQRIPFYIATFPSSPPERPDLLLANFKPEANVGTSERKDVYEIYLDLGLGGEPVLLLSNDVNFNCSWPVTVPATVLFDKNLNDVTLNHGSKWPEDNKYTIQGDSGTITLSKTISSRTTFTYTEASDFEWRSSDPTIANLVVDINYPYNVTIYPTGKSGTVKFILTVLNGGAMVNGVSAAYEVESKELTISAGLNPFLTVPGGDKAARNGFANKDLELYYATNLTELNQGAGQTETEYTWKLYAANTDGTKGNLIATDSSTVASKLTIPGSLLTQVTTSTYTAGYSYIAEISADHVQQGEDNVTFTAEYKVTIKTEPAKVALQKLDNYFVTETPADGISFTITNPSTETRYYYTINGVPSAEAIGTSGTIPADAIPAPQDALKTAYTISVYATNNETVDGWSVDSCVLYVYNGDFIDLLVADVAKGDLGGTTGGKAGEGTESAKNQTITMQNDISEYLQSSPTAGYESVLKTADVFNDRDKLNLQKVVSVNYGEGAWGMLSDQIAWDASDVDSTSFTSAAARDTYSPARLYYTSKEAAEGVYLTKDQYDAHMEGNGLYYIKGTSATVDYEQGGGYSNVDSYIYTSYLPESDMLIVGHQNGQTTIKAMHARSGQEVTLTADVYTLRNKLYLFQFVPAGGNDKVTIQYTNGNGEKVTLENVTDEKGRVAIYEESGIASDVVASMRLTQPIYNVSGNEGSGVKYRAGIYLATFANMRLVSGEPDAATMQLYPVNTSAMNYVSAINFNIVKPDGTPYRGCS